MDKRIKTVIIFILLINAVLVCVMLNLNKAIKEKDEIIASTAILTNQLVEEKELIERELESLTTEYNKLKKTNSNDPRELIKIACEEYDVDYILAISIARVETGNFTSSIYKNYYNIGGLNNGENWYKYNNLTEGVNAYVSTLKTEYIDKGLDTPERMQPKYCPGNDGQHWITLVNKIMEEEQ